jgi:hypothetical protein
MKCKLLLIVCLLCIGCRNTNVRYGSYASSCFIQAETALLLDIHSDNTFQYKFAYNSSLITGEWSVHKDTLIMKSSEFQLFHNIMSPIIKNSSFEGKDPYIFKKNTLYTINKAGLSKECRLIYINSR